MTFTTELIPPDEVPIYIERFHMYGHGIENGVPEQEHLRRVTQEATGLLGLVIFKDNESVAMVTMLPSLVEDSHFPEAGLCCVHLAGKGLGVSGMRELHRGLKRLTLMMGGAWYSVSSRVSKYEYRNRYYPVGDKQ